MTDLAETVHLLDADAESLGVLVLPVSCWECGGRLRVVNDGTGRERGSPGRGWERHVAVGCTATGCHKQWHVKVDVERVMTR